VPEEIFHLKKIDPEFLARERERAMTLLRRILGNIYIKEVGSTAIAGTIGKGDIDLLITVRADDFLSARTKLDLAFERDSDQLSNDIYQAFIIPSSVDIKVQLTVRDGPYDRFEAFLNVLRKDPKVLAQYEALKRSMDGKPMSVYRKAKAQFIQSVLKGST
jgi:GrpB-like predicted nucleotidyltransferase (UPF0157 family)